MAAAAPAAANVTTPPAANVTTTRPMGGTHSRPGTQCTTIQAPSEQRTRTHTRARTYARDGRDALSG